MYYFNSKYCNSLLQLLKGTFHHLLWRNPKNSYSPNILESGNRNRDLVRHKNPTKHGGEMTVPLLQVPHKLLCILLRFEQYLRSLLQLNKIVLAGQLPPFQAPTFLYARQNRYKEDKKTCLYSYRLGVVIMK